MVSRSRMPPPSWTSTSLPTSLRILRIAISFLGWPAKAPLRSTRCRRRAPLSTQLRATTVGSSLKVVDWSMLPCLRRTQWPSLRSIAGIKSMMLQVGGGQRLRQVQPERLKNVALRVPVKEVAVQRQTVVGTFFRVKLGGKNIIARNRRAKALAIVSLTHAVARIRRFGIKTVNKIEVTTVRYVAPHRVRRATVVIAIDLVPSHLRHLKTAAIRL